MILISQADIKDFHRCPAEHKRQYKGWLTPPYGSTGLVSHLINGYLTRLIMHNVALGNCRGRDIFGPTSAIPYCPNRYNLCAVLLWLSVNREKGTS